MCVCVGGGGGGVRTALSMGGLELHDCVLEVCDFGLKFMQVPHIGENGWTLHGPTYERAQP